MNVIVWWSRDNRLFTVNLKWLWLQKIIVLDWSISQLGLTSTPEECTRCPYFSLLCLISQNTADSVAPGTV